MIRPARSLPENIKPLVETSQGLYFSRGDRVFLRMSSGEQRCIGSLGLPIPFRAASRTRLLERLLRLEPSGGYEMSPDRVFITGRKKIFLSVAGEARLTPVFDVPRGSRPLGICVAPEMFAFGEYFGNSHRDEVRIFASSDGSDWACVHTFPKETVRHIHNLVWDPHRNGIWVLTGDYEQEAGIWFTDDYFRSLLPVVRGTQRARATNVIPLREGLIVPTDSEIQQNYIQLLDVERGTFCDLAKLSGSSLSAAIAGGVYLISTSAEKNNIAPVNDVTVMASADGINWQEILRERRDWLSGQFARPYFQHPNVQLCNGPDDARRIHAYCISVGGLDGMAVSWSAETVRRFLRKC